MNIVLEEGLNFKLDKRWIDLDDEVDNIQENGGYIVISLGIKTIDPKKIISLSRELSYSKLEKLRESVKSAGWNDPYPNTLSLLILSDGRCIVDGGGNHRAVISNEFNIEKIHAKITVHLEEDTINEDDLSFIREKQQKIEDLFKAKRAEKDSKKINVLSDAIDETNKEISEREVIAYYNANKKYNHREVFE